MGGEDIDEVVRDASPLTRQDLQKSQSISPA